MLHLHRAERTARLADGLAGLLADPLADPFATEVVAVPAKGVERWLAQRLSTVLGAGPRGDGICSGIRFPSSGRLVDEALAVATGTDPRADPWADPTWALLEVLDACVGEPWCAVLAAHVGAGAAGEGAGAHRRGRRWATAAHLGELFRSYAAHRPGMLRDWAAGRDTDGSAPLPGDLRWQAELWRRLRERLGPSPAEDLAAACAVLRAEPGRSDLPDRVSVFGPTRLSTQSLAVLDALAAGREMHLWLPHPSPALWSALAGRTATRRAEDTSATVARHPLLRSLGRDVRELQLRLPEHVDVHHTGPDGDVPGTLLARLQADLRDDRPPAAGGTLDGTVQVHACHGPARQVEVLREVLLRLFQDDPTLEPRDVLVLCPDVETFAPLVSATFGLGPDLPHPGNALRVRLADRSLRQTNPLLDTVALLLELADGRVTASQVLDLAATPGVRRAFGFDDEDLERIRDWVARSGVRWGLDTTTRAAYAMERVPQNTWRAGLDRVLLGVTTSEDQPVWLGLALPLDDVDSTDVDLAGRLAELVDRLEDVLTALSGEHPVGHWVHVLAAALDSLTTTEPDDAWQLAQARRELAETAEGGTAPVRLADVRAMLASRLRGRPTRANFRTGNLTVCTLVPMRSVPHRVVVLLGLDDGVFPRSSGVDGDDVLARDPRVGERDVPSEDRQLLLDAVLSAGERLVVVHTGADPVSGATRPPAVPVGELLDVLAAMVPADRDRIVRRHPLQPHDARQFTGATPLSFDPVALAGARQAARARAPEPARRPLPPRGGPVALDDLVSFVEHPVRAYLRQRLQITLPGEDDEVADALSASLDALQEWAVGDRLLTAGLAGVPAADAERSEWLRGTLPPGALGARVLQRVGRRVVPLVGAAAPLLAAPSRAVDVRVDLGGGRELSGTVNGVREDAVVSVTYSSLAAKHRVRAWVLALALAATEGRGTAVTVGRRGDRARTSTIVAPPDPRAALAGLVDLYDRGLCEPLPLAAKASECYARARAGGGTSVEQALESAGQEWAGGRFPGEREDRHHVHVWGTRAPISALAAAAPLDDERWPDERTRFGVLARRLWSPLLDAETTS
ncbi:exodeoxyribonuclease V subunit gamma [Modestobacter sp. I12A-02628]|uniref:RecBCD enzyme subunit RecC n=1 Tax=Goekera deserti TaxID=2497753 RepID=A0A7K3WDH8_9ACTN|nr:exodeoxyribonuclease V subunit gamma [Goekera deserti]MPQ97148.1 exodeoxyribonuclease V subunit gamma [Goekera deserti]NDI46534.1 exodeoxyribonuclease V subunit gamma [Goekera deserti]NEL54532.1 exodeoxyribonuclease V subunit gamma [Goekera deserti]